MPPLRLAIGLTFWPAFLAAQAVEMAYEAPAGNEPRFHRITVTVVCPGLRVRCGHCGGL